MVVLASSRSAEAKTAYQETPACCLELDEGGVGLVEDGLLSPNTLAVEGSRSRIDKSHSRPSGLQRGTESGLNDPDALGELQVPRASMISGLVGAPETLNEDG